MDFQGDSLQDIGPGPEFPRRRAQNRYSLYASATKITHRHSIKAGWGMARVQVNDLQDGHRRGTLLFAADFGRSEIENFLLGYPAQLTFTLGDLYRGFRSWEHFFYLGDQLPLTSRLSLSWGLRYEVQTAPSEVNGRTTVGYSTDRTNWAPRLGLGLESGWQEHDRPGGLRDFLRQRLPETYQFARFNGPGVQVIRIPSPPLVRLFSLPGQNILPGEQEVLHRISPDLVTPYSQQYSLAVESSLPAFPISASGLFRKPVVSLFTQNVSNRALPVPGVEASTATIDARRRTRARAISWKLQAIAMRTMMPRRSRLKKDRGRGVSFRPSIRSVRALIWEAILRAPHPASTLPPRLCFDLPIRLARVRPQGTEPVRCAAQPDSYLFVCASSVRHITGWTGLLLRDWNVSGTTIFQSGLPWHARTSAARAGERRRRLNDDPTCSIQRLLGESFDHPDNSAGT